MDNCTKSFSDPLSFANHIYNHQTDTCQVRLANGKTCGHVFGDEGRVAHYEVAHGLLCTRGVRVPNVQHCNRCESYQVSEPAIPAHKIEHLSPALTEMEQDPWCLGFQGFLDRLYACPFHLADESLPDLIRLSTSDGTEAAIQHLITSHILMLDPEGKSKCPFPQAPCQTPRSPPNLINRLIDRHDLRLAGGPGKQKTPFNGDYASLKLGSSPSSSKRRHSLRIYSLASFQFFSDPQRSCRALRSYLAHPNRTILHA